MLLCVPLRCALALRPSVADFGASRLSVCATAPPPAAAASLRRVARSVASAWLGPRLRLLAPSAWLGSRLARRVARSVASDVL